jgi:hypothetical protein
MSDLVFRDLETLTRFSHHYIDEFRSHLNSLHPDLFAHLDLVPELEPNVGRAVLSYFLSAACQCQNILNIELGRASLLALPREWVLQHIEEAAEPLLRAEEEWEYRRLLEVCWKLDFELVRKLASRGMGSENPEVRETGEDCLKELVSLTSACS